MKDVKMKINIFKLITALSLAITALIGAEETCPKPYKYYASAFAGANWLHLKNIEYAKFKVGYAGVAALGMVINPDWRVEVEGSYRRNELDYLKVFAGHHVHPKLHSDTKALLANLYYEMNFGSAIRPYIGLGLGYSEIRMVYSSHYENLTEKKGQVCSQVILGAKTSLTESVDLGLEYRYFTSKHDIVQQNVGLSLTQLF